MRIGPVVAWTTGTVAAGTGLYVGLVTGSLTLDIGVGRSTRPLGPIELEIAAPRQVVYDVAAAPYTERQTRAMREKVQILERGEGMVVAAHLTPLSRVVGWQLMAKTVEAVIFDPPGQMGFRLLRGPVPDVSESFTFTQTAPATTKLRYDGQLGTDFWDLGARWGAVVARTWEDTVRRSLAQIKVEAERRRLAFE
jgi:hypothetical protein